MTELVHYDVGEGVATLTLDSQHNRNALSRRLVSELVAHLATAEADDEVKVVVVRAEGRTFCPGPTCPRPARTGWSRRPGCSSTSSAGSPPWPSRW